MTGMALTERSFGTLVIPQVETFRSKELTFVKVPKGGSTWEWENVLGVHRAPTLKGVMCCLTEPQHDLWPRVSDASSGSTPYMRSLDGVTAKIVGTDSGDLNTKEIEAARIGDTDRYDCRKLSYFQWRKEGDKNYSPRAKNVSVVGVHTADYGMLFVRLPPTSSYIVQKFAAELKSAGCEPWMATVSVGLELVKGGKGPFTRVVPKFVDRVPAEFSGSYRTYFETVSPLLRGTLEMYQPRVSEAAPF